MDFHHLICIENFTFLPIAILSPIDYITALAFFQSNESKSAKPQKLHPPSPHLCTTQASKGKSNFSVACYLLCPSLCLSLRLLLCLSLCLSLAACAALQYPSFNLAQNRHQSPRDPPKSILPKSPYFIFLFFYQISLFFSKKTIDFCIYQ